MEKQLLGIAFVFFGILLCILELTGGFWIPFIDYLPWNILGLFTGIIGLVIIIKNTPSSKK